MACAALLAAALAPAARAGDVALLRAVAGDLPRAERADGVQAQYDTARVLEFSLARRSPGLGAL